MDQAQLNAVNHHCVCFGLRKTTRAVTQFYDHILEPSGIRSTQFTLMSMMAASSARTMTELANSLVMDRTTLTRNLKPLEKMGMIMSVGSQDKRSKVFALSPAGQDALNRAIPLWESAQNKLVHALSAEKLGQMQRVLEEVSKVVL